MLPLCGMEMWENIIVPVIPNITNSRLMKLRWPKRNSNNHLVFIVCMHACAVAVILVTTSFSMMHTEKWERAWYSISSDQRHLVPNMGRVGEGYTLHVGSIPYKSYLAHVFVMCSVCALSSGFKTERDIISCPALKT